MLFIVGDQLLVTLLVVVVLSLVVAVTDLLQPPFSFALEGTDGLSGGVSDDDLEVFLFIESTDVFMWSVGWSTLFQELVDPVGFADSKSSLTASCVELLGDFSPGWWLSVPDSVLTYLCVLSVELFVGSNEISVLSESS